MAVRDRSRLIRSFLAAALTLALLLAPALTRFGMAFAAQPHQAHLIDQARQCHMQHSGTSAPKKSAGKCCCTSTSFGVALETAAPLDDIPMQRSPLVFARTSFHIQLLGEIATPPPRLV